jgi:hypothetical protein
VSFIVCSTLSWYCSRPGLGRWWGNLARAAALGEAPMVLAPAARI